MTQESYLRKLWVLRNSLRVADRDFVTNPISAHYLIKEASRLLEELELERVVPNSTASSPGETRSRDKIVEFLNHFRETLGLKLGVSEDATQPSSDANRQA